MPSKCVALGSVLRAGANTNQVAPPYFLSKLLTPKPTPVQLAFLSIFLFLESDISSSPVINQ